MSSDALVQVTMCCRECGVPGAVRELDYPVREYDYKPGYVVLCYTKGCSLAWTTLPHRRTPAGARRLWNAWQWQLWNPGANMDYDMRVALAHVLKEP